MEEKLIRSNSSNSMPSLISKLDHLDSMMSNLEGKKKCSSARWASSEAESVDGLVKRECVPLDLAVKEAQSKGSLLDRITSLEKRIIQLCLDIESEAASPSKNSDNATSPRTSKKSFSSSFSRFRLLNRNHSQKQTTSEVSLDKFHQHLDEKQQHYSKAEPSNEAPDQGKHSSRKTTKEEKSSSPKQKKFIPSNLLHLRLLGC